MRLAFRCIAGRERSGIAGGIGQTRRTLECLAVISSLARRSQRDAFASAFRPTGGVVIDRRFDATPVLVQFGMVGDQLRRFARYLMQCPQTGKWLLLRLEDYRRLRGMRVRPQFGVVELLAQNASIRWLDEHGVRNPESIFVPPCAVASSCASNIWQALQALAPETDDAALVALSNRVRIAILHDVADSCAANLRLIAFVASRLPSNMLHVHVPCVAHVVHLILTGSPSDCASESTAIGDVYAGELIGRIPTHHERMIANVKVWLERELVIHDDGRQPSEVDRCHFEGVLENTLLRYVNHVRGRLLQTDDPASTLSSPKVLQRLEDGCAKLKAFFNGDLRLPYPQHIVCDSTRGLSRPELVEMGTRAIIDSCLIPGLMSALPSKSRWGSMLECLQRQVAGCRRLHVVPSTHSVAPVAPLQVCLCACVDVCVCVCRSMRSSVCVSVRSECWMLIHAPATPHTRVCGEI